MHKSDEEWQTALQRAVDKYPRIKDIDWSLAFGEDLDMMGRIIGDILKLQKAEENPHRRGRRTVPQVSKDQLWLLFEGFSTEAFPVAAAKLIDGRSLRAVALRCNISHMTLYRFMKSEAVPSMKMMEQIAAAFNKPPYYFLEYRAELIGNLVRQALIEKPNISVAVLRDALKDI